MIIFANMKTKGSMPGSTVRAFETPKSSVPIKMGLLIVQLQLMFISQKQLLQTRIELNGEKLSQLR